MRKHQYRLHFDPACRTLLLIDNPDRGHPDGLAIKIDHAGPVSCEALRFEPAIPPRPGQLRSSWMSVRVDALAELAVEDADSPLWRAVDAFSRPADPTHPGNVHLRQLETLLTTRFRAALIALGFDMTAGTHVTRHRPHELVLTAAAAAQPDRRRRGTGHVWL